jgi:hypothetical protein
VGSLFEELDRSPTPMGEISLRRRLEPSLDVEVYEARLDDELLDDARCTRDDPPVGSSR